MQYKNIIFDLGNVLVKLNSLGCMNAFKVLGMEKLIDSNPEAKRLMGELGEGLISTEQFCDAARNLSLTTVSNHQIIEAANRMLVVIPDEKKRRLLKLKAKGYRLFLLSNTIDIHWDYCVEKLFPYQGHNVEDYFENVFLSQRRLSLQAGCKNLRGSHQTGSDSS